MKKALRHLFAAIVLAALGFACLSWARLEAQLATVSERHATLDYNGTEVVLEHAARIFEYASHVPFFGKGPLNEVLAQKAAASYWRHDYGSLIPAQGDPIGALSPDNIELQFIVANAVYRRADAQAADLPTRLQAIDSGIAAQLAVLRNSVRNEDAAFNYEYLLKLRAALTALKSVPRDGEEGGEEKTTHGQPGGEPQETKPNQYKIHTPLESKEFQDQKAGEQAGKTVERKRKG
ncbi:MAG: hypothetical protein WDO68_30485 [Gammaproteobacteria bacterium]